MSMKLLPNEVCPLMNTCKYANNDTTKTICQGINPLRNSIFICDFLNNNGEIQENRFRNSFDQTGKMKVILE